VCGCAHLLPSKSLHLAGQGTSIHELPRRGLLGDSISGNKVF
jgi:hypothetical protein